MDEQTRRLCNAITLLADDKYGREFLRWLLNNSGIMRSAGAPADMAHAGYAEGKRIMGELVLTLIYAAKLPAGQVADIFREEIDHG
ncbi:MAG: hypothetical protein E7022_05900 [Desulfovibrio desulfuricans]|nr:hypothetical protein [Desulfovibrio desulfuricans]